MKYFRTRRFIVPLTFILAISAPLNLQAVVVREGFSCAKNREKALRRTLKEHERRGGHTMRRHVGRSRKWLRDRLRRRRRLRAASSFKNYRTAESIVRQVLLKRRRKIALWLRRVRSGAIRSFRIEGRRLSGYGWRRSRRGVYHFNQYRRARVVIRALADCDFYVLTAYPY